MIHLRFSDHPPRTWCGKPRNNGLRHTGTITDTTCLPCLRRALDDFIVRYPESERRAIYEKTIAEVAPKKRKPGAPARRQGGARKKQ